MKKDRHGIRRLLALLLLAVLAAALLSGCGDAGLKWKLANDGTLTVSGSGSMEEWKAVKFADRDFPWAEKRDQIRSVVVQDGVTDIAVRAFSGCTALTAVTLPGSLTAIGSAAFENCTNLAEAKLPDSVTSLGRGAFRGCSALRSVGLPSGISFLGESLFGGCTGLTQIVLPDGLEAIGSGAFAGCTGLTAVVLPRGLTEIAQYAFRDCTGLTEITLPAGLMTVNSLAFTGCSQLTAVHVDPANTEYRSVDGVVFGSGFEGLPEFIAVYPDGLTALNQAWLPEDLVYAGEELPEGTLDVGAALSGGSFRVVPLTVEGLPDSDLYDALPEENRALSVRGADFALLEVFTSEERSDYHREGSWTVSKTGAYDMVTTVFLCAPDGSYAQLASFRHEPPSSGTPPLYGDVASVEEIMDAVGDLFG